MKVVAVGVVLVAAKVAVKRAQKVSQVARAMALPLHAVVAPRKAALAVIVKTVRKEALMAHLQIVSTIAVIVATTDRMTDPMIEAWTAEMTMVPEAMSCHATSIRS